MKSEVVEENPSYATQEIVDKTKKLTEDEALDPVADLGINLLYDKLADVEARQDRVEETLQTLSKAQQEVSKKQETMARDIVELKKLVIEILKRLDKNNARRVSFDKK